MPFPDYTVALSPKRARKNTRAHALSRLLKNLCAVRFASGWYVIETYLIPRSWIWIVRWSDYWHIPRHRFLVGLCLELRVANSPPTKDCTASGHGILYGH
jgi:hypothetical protein